VLTRLHYQEHGSGEPFLFIHGFGANIFSWRYLVSPLSKRARLLLVDLKGFGSSPKPIDGDYSIYDQARLISRFALDNDLTSLTIVGHSYGGGVALVTSLYILDEAPQRLKRLILVDSIAYEQQLPQFIRILRTPMLGRLIVSLTPKRLQVLAILKLAYYDDTKIPQEAIEEYAKPLNTPGGEQALLQTAKKIIPPDVDALTIKYKRIRTPTLIIWGKEDRVVPLEIGERLNQDIPNSRLVVVDRCGHIPHEERPEKTLQIIEDFLAS
jgi:pimeloyl-ACP methyl ester carboxylesterase